MAKSIIGIASGPPGALWIKRHLWTLKGGDESDKNRTIATHPGSSLKEESENNAFIRRLLATSDYLTKCHYALHYVKQKQKANGHKGAISSYGKVLDDMKHDIPFRFFSIRTCYIPNWNAMCLLITKTQTAVAPAFKLHILLNRNFLFSQQQQQRKWTHIQQSHLWGCAGWCWPRPCWRARTCGRTRRPPPSWARTNVSISFPISHL